ncbi:MAG: tetratricopeptide repeat protein [Bacteroidales bacterium]|nr:tetratricopeptide repeat protein [Bacteroidales bacterium]
MKSRQQREQLPEIQKLWSDWVYAQYFETPKEEITCLKELLDLDDQSATACYVLGDAYAELKLYDEATRAYERAFEIYEQWDSKPKWVWDYVSLGDMYHKTGKFREERRLYKKAEKDFPGNRLLIYSQAVLALSEGKRKESEALIEEYRSVSTAQKRSESLTCSNIAGIYHEAGLTEEAEEYYRKALSLEPGNPDRMNNLAWFLIDENLNIEEGIELTEKALQLRPDYYLYLETMGLGLYKAGKYREASEILQKGWDLRINNARYDHDAFLNLEAAKKAVAGPE